MLTRWIKDRSDSLKDTSLQGHVARTSLGNLIHELAVWRDTLDYFLQTHAQFSWFHLTHGARTHIFLFRQQCPARVHLSPLPLRPCFHYRGYQFTTVANLGCELAGIGMHPTGCLWRRVHRPWVWASPRHRLGVEIQLEGGRGRKLESVRIIALCFPAGEQGSSTPLLPTPHCKTSATVSKTYPALTTWFLGVPLPWESVTNIVSHWPGCVCSPWDPY